MKEKKRKELPKRIILQIRSRGHLEGDEIRVHHGVPYHHCCVAVLLVIYCTLTDPLSSEWVRGGRQLAGSPEVSHCGCGMTQLCHEQQMSQREIAWSLARAGEQPHGL